MTDLFHLPNIDFNHFGKSSTFKGELLVMGPTFIASNFSGSITISDPKTKLTIEHSGNVDGIITGGSIIIIGKFKGEIITGQTVIIHPCARVSGKITATNIQIYPGSEVNAELVTQQT